jgi:hypothetical protein
LRDDSIWSAALGAGVGGLLGALVPPDTTSRPHPRTRGQTAALGALAGFLVGTATWMIMSPEVHWTPVPLGDGRSSAGRRRDRRQGLTGRFSRQRRRRQVVLRRQVS